MIDAILKKYTDTTQQPVPPMPAFKKPEIYADEDETDTIEKFITAGTKAGLSCFITYEDSKGKKSQRRITVKGCKYHEDGAFLVHAFCHERKAARTFKINNIAEVVNITTGEIISDKSAIKALFHDDEENSQNITLADIRKHRDALNILAFLSRCDGRQHTYERDVMIHYMVDQCFEDDLDGGFLEDYFRQLYPTDFVFHACVQSALKKGDLKIILKYAIRLAEADGIVHEKEHQFISEMENTLSNARNA